MAGCGERPRLKVREIRCEGLERVLAHALSGQVLQRLDVVVRQELCEAVAAVHRQDGRESVQLQSATCFRIGLAEQLPVDVHAPVPRAPCRVQDESRGGDRKDSRRGTLRQHRRKQRRRTAPRKSVETPWRSSDPSASPARSNTRPC